MGPEVQREIFNRAARVVQRGWCQGAFILEEKGGARRCCAAQALQEACGTSRGSTLHFEAMQKLSVFLGHRSEFGSLSEIVWWNDLPTTTKDSVVAALEDVAQSKPCGEQRCFDYTPAAD